MNEGAPNLNLQPAEGADSRTEANLADSPENSWKSLAKYALDRVAEVAKPRVEAWVNDNLPKIKQIPGKLFSKFTNFLTKTIPAKLKEVREDRSTKRNWLEEEKDSARSPNPEVEFERPRPAVVEELDLERAEYEEKRRRLEELLTGGFDAGIEKVVRTDLEALILEEGERTRQKPLAKMDSLNNDLDVALENANARIDDKIAGIKEKYDYGGLMRQKSEIEIDSEVLDTRSKKAEGVILRYQQLLNSNSGVLKREERREIEDRIKELENIRKEAQRELSRMVSQKKKIENRIAKADRKIQPWEDLKRKNLDENEENNEDEIESDKAEVIENYKTELEALEKKSQYTQETYDSCKAKFEELRDFLKGIKVEGEGREALEFILEEIKEALELKYPVSDVIYNFANYIHVIVPKLEIVKNNLK